MSQTYFAILTAVGEAKLANAAALNVPLQISRMAVGDGGGTLPVPLRTQTALIGEQYRADLNTLQVDPLNASQIIAELVIPEAEGGYWLREMGLYDAAGDLIAVSNCPPSYKPQLAEGSGRTQVLRMVLIVSSTAALQLKIDPSVVLATRDFVTTTVAAALARLDGKDSVKAATTANLAALSGLLTVDDVVLVAGDRVLVKDQAIASQNGIYVAAAGAWARSADADTSVEVTPGMTVPVEQGTTFADTIWELTTNAPITLGTTALVFELTAALNATQVDAETGTNNTRRMTALRVFQAMRSAAANATEALRGVLRIATQAELDDGTLNNVAITPAGLKSALDGFAPSGFFSGFQLANNSVTPNTTIDVGAGAARSSDGTVSIKTTSIIRGLLQNSGAWTAGDNQNKLDTGAKAINSWYHVFAIRKTSDGSGDILFSLAATAPTVPVGYAGFRRIGAVRTDGGGNIIPFINVGRKFVFKTPRIDARASSGTASFTVPIVVSAPPGVRVMLRCHAGGYANGTFVYVRSTDSAAIAIPAGGPGDPAWVAGVGTSTPATEEGISQECHVMTDTSATIVMQGVSAFGFSTYTLTTLGYKEL